MSEPKKKGRRLNKFEREAHLSEVMRLYLRKVSKADIAKRLGVDRSQITYDVNAVEKKLKAQQIDDLEQAKKMQLMELQYAKAELYEAWDKSKKVLWKKGRKLKGVESTQLPDMEGDEEKKAPIYVERTMQREQRYGDVRVMGKIVDIINLEAELLGTKAPKRLEHAGNDGGPVLFESRQAWFDAVTPLLDTTAMHLGDGAADEAD